MERGAVQRARSSRVDPGGKGVNVARALAANGRKVAAVLPVGGAEGAQLVDLLAASGIELVLVPVARPVRSNVSVVEADGTETKLNAPGPELSTAEIEALVAATVDVASRAEWVAGCGSLAPGFPEDFWRRLVGLVKAQGARMALDSSGAAFRAALPSRPDVVKPNLEELAEAVGRPLVTVGDALQAARELRGLGVGAVLVSLGGAGALLVDADGEVHGEAPVEVVRGTVGAGDALLAGFLSAGGGVGALAEGLAWAAAACSLPGSAMPTPEQIDRSLVRIHETVAPERAPGGA